ncbi:pseudouridine synthase [uncultured Sphingomonas sp.]|uniref:pseudouridine synthase n=1 Tax=uncultured Sphingomonas sp. TaxID=158754 RepID=UPI0025F90283|nr:pseudouridine synthase [uncultured Sphingomonas sp.]
MAEEPAQHRIAKLLARAGVASRRDVERMIADSRISLNGTVIDTPATLLETLDGVAVDGEPVAPPEPTRLFLFHKPGGYLTAARDPAGRPTIYDRLPADLPRLVPVGRLDLNTEGLLLMTTDGEFKRQLELPSTGVERAYRARAYGEVTQTQLEELIDGVEIEGVRYGSIDANLERRTGANVWVEMILTEGKNREVRRVLEYLGLQVSRLIRTRYGPFVLGDLPVGGIGEVRGADLVAFRQSLKAGSKGKADRETTISATALRRGTVSRSSPPAVRGDGERAGARSSAASGTSYDPATADRRPRLSEPDRRMRRGPSVPARTVGGTGQGNGARAPSRPPSKSADHGPRTGTKPPRASGAEGRRDAHGEVRPQTKRAAFNNDNTQQQRGRPDARSTRGAASEQPRDDSPPARPAKLQRKAGWAKPKPKTGPGTRKPRA